MRNKLIDLNDHLFEQLERLNDEDLEGEELEKELKRARAMSSISSNIIDNAALMLDAQKHVDEYYGTNHKKDIPEILKIGNKE